MCVCVGMRLRVCIWMQNPDDELYKVRHFETESEMHSYLFVNGFYSVLAVLFRARRARTYTYVWVKLICGNIFLRSDLFFIL